MTEERDRENKVETQAGASAAEEGRPGAAVADASVNSEGMDAAAPAADGAGASSHELEAALKQNAEYLDALRRLQAEFDNFKKRTRKEKAETIEYANERILLRLLPVLDNLERAVQFGRENGLKEDIAHGIDMIARQLTELLAEHGVDAFESMNAQFDPTRHEPLTTLENAETPENTVVQEFEKGYMMRERILRMAKVCISRLPSPSEKPEERRVEDPAAG